jgi:hypothetical protein
MYLGARAKLQRGWGGFDCRRDGLQRADFPSIYAQMKAEGMSQLYASQPSNADASMDDYDDEEDDEDDMEEVME